MFIAATAIMGIFFSLCSSASGEFGTDDFQQGVSGDSFSFSGGPVSPPFMSTLPEKGEVPDYFLPSERGYQVRELGAGFFCRSSEELLRGDFEKFSAEKFSAEKFSEGNEEREGDREREKDEEKCEDGIPEVVYVYLFPAFSTHVLDPYVRVLERDENNHVAAVGVSDVSVEELASLEGVRTVQPVSPPLVRKINPGIEITFVPELADSRLLYGSTGKGIKVGIISDGVADLSRGQASGALPPDVHVLAPGEGNEGTAMLEIVHGIAPESELYFHGAGSNKLEFNRAVDALLAEGCQIICDDIGWPDEPFFEDGVVASHVEEVLESQDLLYVSAAGNDANRHYQGLFFDDGSGWHDFGSGNSSSKNLYVDIPAGGEVTVVLQWNDPWNRSKNDYDLYLKDCSSGKELATCKNTQDGAGTPLEFVKYTNRENATIKGMVCIKKYSGKPKVLEVYIYPGSLGDVYPDNLVEEDSVFGHPAVPGVLCVGAISSETPGAAGIEPYSSRGPVSIYFPEYELREKTDISGLGKVELKGQDKSGSLFAGTSASAPCVAGVAALVWSAHPEKNGSEIREILCSTAEDLGDPGYDNVFGHGSVDARAMLV